MIGSFVEEISRLLVFVPDKHIEYGVTEVFGSLRDRHPDSIDLLEEEEISKTVEKVYTRLFQPIIDSFLAFIDASDNKQLVTRVNTQTTYYLKNRVQDILAAVNRAALLQ